MVRLRVIGFLLVFVGVALLVATDDERQPIFEPLRSRIGIDTRSLAFFRMMIGGLLVVDILLRVRNFQFFYTNSGAVPIELAQNYAPAHAFSLYYLSGSAEWTGVLFLSQLVLGLTLILGWQTRIITILAFLLVVSLEHRNPLVTSYSDTLLRHLLFFGIFLPLGAQWSLDARRRDTNYPRLVTSLASMLILLQMVLLYLVNGFHKHQSPLWRSGDALEVVLALDSVTFLFGDWLGNYPTFLRFGSLLWLYLLTFSFLLILLTGWRRAMYAAMLVSGHLLLAGTVRIGEFSYVAIAGLLLFIPPVAWEHIELEDRLRAIHSKFRYEVPFRIPAHPTVQRPWRGSNLVRRNNVTAVLVFLILLLAGADMVVVTLQTTGQIDSAPLPLQEEVSDLQSRFGISQPEWTIFAPDPQKSDEWYVVAVETVDGARIDLHNERALSDRRPEPLNSQWDTYRERFYWEELEHSDVADAYLEYVCRGQSDHVSDVGYVTVYQFLEIIDPDRRITYDHPEHRERHRNVLVVDSCGDRTPVRIKL